MIYKLCMGVWARSYPQSTDIRLLIDAGVKTFVDLTRIDERFRRRIPYMGYRKCLPDGVDYVNFPLWSGHLPPIRSLMRIVEIVEERQPAYLHCRHGRDRTGVAATLILVNRGLSPDEALCHIADARGPGSEQSPRKRYHLDYLKDAAGILTAAGAERAREAAFDTNRPDDVFRIVNGGDEMLVKIDPTDPGQLKAAYEVAKLTGKGLKRLFLGKPRPGKELRKAAGQGRLEDVAAHTGSGEDVDSRSRSGKTPLMKAADNGNLNAAMYLVGEGADINASGGDSGKTPLMRAAKYGHWSMAKFFLDNGANVNARNKKGRTALYYARKKRQVEVAALLVGYGAKW
jgi:hypothetical protein